MSVNASKLSSDYVSDILDEIALEGLDGITIEVLWMRLSVRNNFCFKIDENTKDFLWKIIIQMKDVRFYELPESRPSIKYCDYSMSVDSQNASLELDSIYPYCKLKNVTGVFGSCKHYSTRIDITDQVIRFSLKEANERWGNKLVVVASQQMRSFALLGNSCTPDIDFTKSTVNYDILERIGRCRYLGLATYGKGSIQSVVEDSKSIFHYLKFLHHHKLIKKQCLPGSLNANLKASKIYLTRFFEECLNDNMTILQTAIDELKTRPNYAMTCSEFNALFDGRKKKRLKKFIKSSIFKKYISVSKNQPYRTFFPEASQSEWERKSKNGERIVRCFQLINSEVDVADIIEKDCDAYDEESSSGFLPRGIYYENMPILAQAFHHIKNSGAKGITQIELGIKMGLNNKFIRGLTKRLSGEKHCRFYIENDGRRRSKRYIVGEDVQTKAAASEIVQILSETANSAVASMKIENVEEIGEKSQANASIEKINVSQLQEENVSYRTLRRIGMIIKLIKAHRFRLFRQILKYVNEEEIKEGVTSRVDRATIKRILQKLEKDKLIKIIKKTGKDKTDHTIKLYTDPTFEPDEKLLENIYHTHFLYNSLSSTECHGENEMNLENEFAETLLENLAEMKKMLEGVVQKSDKPNIGYPTISELVYSPKFIRLNILHDLIFHLVYDYTGIVDKSQEELISELSQITAVDEDLKKEMPKLYGNQLSTHMFVPPLNDSKKIPGWLLISDILIRMPLSVMVKTLRVSETTPELWKYLHHPVRKHFLVKDLPLCVRQIFFNRKHQLSTIYNDFRRLCFMGLIQFGPKFGREHYQTFIYLNRRASLLDTSTSPPEYYQVPADVKFEVKPYYFESKTDLKKYWMDMFNICMGTNLGIKTHMIGKEILTERESAKESLKKLVEPKTVAKAKEDDDGRLPGDRLGAAGLDSVMYSFLRGNWTGPIKKTKEEVTKWKTIKIPFQKLKKEQVKKRMLLKRNRRKKGIVKVEKFNLSTASTEENAKKIVRLRKVKERELRFKRKKTNSYDEIDLEALKQMETLRVTWSTAEDNLLLICRVAMMFLCPNTRTFVRIPWSEVRKVLQENLPESRNKTQKSIARRIIYMLKNPTTVRSVNLCLEELKEMPESSTVFDCSDLLNSIKPSTPNVTELENLLYRKFHQLVSFLKDRFVDGTNFDVKKKDRDLIPDNLNEFRKIFQLEKVPEFPVTVKSIRENVIRAILMSSLSCRADKTSSAVQLFEIYRQYNDDELQAAIKKLRFDKVITISRKAGNAVFKSGKILPLTFAPYKFSFAFQNLLNTRYSHAMYHESSVQISKLLDKEDGEEFEINLNECNVALFLLASKGFVSFRTIIPDQIIILDSGNISDTRYSKMLQRYREMLRFCGSTSKVVCSSGKIITRSEDEESPETVNGERKKRRLSEETEHVSPKKLKSENASDGDELGEGKEEKTTDDGMESSKVDAGHDPSEKEQSNAEKMTRSSRVILYMMREEAKKEANKDSGKVGQEFCVVNASKVMIKIDKNGLERYSKEMGPKMSAATTKRILNRSSVPLTLIDENSAVAKESDDESTSDARKTLDFICSKKELGATVGELKTNFRKAKSLSEILKRLIESKIVIKSGIKETRYVSQKYSTPWLLSSFKMTRLEREKLKPNEVAAVALDTLAGNESDSDEIPKKKMKGIVSMNEIKTDSYVPPSCSTDVNNKIKIILRPWIRIDGSLNRKVLDRFLGTVLGFVMMRPGISIKSVKNKFSPFITPAWTKDLIEILFEIGCVTLTSLVVTEKASLFSKSVVRVSDCYSGLEDDNFVAVEAKVDAITTLGLFIGKKNYSKDFLVK